MNNLSNTEKKHLIQFIEYNNDTEFYDDQKREFTIDEINLIKEKLINSHGMYFR